MNLPKARTADLLEMEAGGELLIYDLRINKAYNLNETLKPIYRACGGVVSFEELKHRYKLTDDLIHFALGELKANDLIEGEVANHFAGLNRRAVIKKVGLACAATLPVIAGIAAPSAAHAASNGRQANNETCTTFSEFGDSTECASGYCVPSTNTGTNQRTLRCCASSRAGGSSAFGTTGYTFRGADLNDCNSVAGNGGGCCSGTADYLGNGICACR